VHEVSFAVLALVVVCRGRFVLTLSEVGVVRVSVWGSCCLICSVWLPRRLLRLLCAGFFRFSFLQQLMLMVEVLCCCSFCHHSRWSSSSRSFIVGVKLYHLWLNGTGVGVVAAPTPGEGLGSTGLVSSLLGCSYENRTSPELPSSLFQCFYY